MKYVIKPLIILALILCAAACHKYDENDHSMPVPEIFEGKVVDQNGIGLRGVTVETLIRSNQHGAGPDGVPKDRLARRIAVESDENGRFLFDFRSESKKIAADFPSHTPVVDRFFAIKVRSFEYVYIKFFGDTTFVVNRSDLRSEIVTPQSNLP